SCGADSCHSISWAWPLWLRHAGVPKLESEQTISVDSFVAAIQAAEQGLGVALGLEPFIAERERLGTICRPLPFAHPTGAYWLVHPRGAQRNRALRQFHRLAACRTSNCCEKWQRIESEQHERRAPGSRPRVRYCGRPPANQKPALIKYVKLAYKFRGNDS